MRFLKLFISTSILLTACTTPPPMPVSNEPLCVEGEVVADGLNMRTGPSTRDDIIVTLPRGTPVVLAQCSLAASQSGTWVEIKIGPRGEEITGWVSSKPQFLQLRTL